MATYWRTQMKKFYKLTNIIFWFIPNFYFWTNPLDFSSCTRKYTVIRISIDIF